MFYYYNNNLIEKNKGIYFFIIKKFNMYGKIIKKVVVYIILNKNNIS